MARIPGLDGLGGSEPERIPLQVEHHRVIVTYCFQYYKECRGMLIKEIDLSKVELSIDSLPPYVFGTIPVPTYKTLCKKCDSRKSMKNHFERVSL